MVVKWMFELGSVREVGAVYVCVCVSMACSDVHWMEEEFFLNADELQKVVCGTKWTTIIMMMNSFQW